MKWLIFLLTLLLPINAMATEYHVATDGSGDFTTIAQVNAAIFQPGDSVLFNKGQSWIEQLNVVSGVTYSSYGSGNKPVIRNIFGDCLNTDLSNIIIDGLAINTNVLNVLVYPNDSTNFAIYFVSDGSNSATNIIIKNCDIYISRYGIFFRRINPDNITECCFHSITIQNNNVYSNSGYGISLYLIDGVSCIKGNKVYDNGLNAVLSVNGIWLANCQDVIVEDNEVYNNDTGYTIDCYDGVGVFLDYTGIQGCLRCIIRNNICYNHDSKIEQGHWGNPQLPGPGNSAGIALMGGSSENRIYNNICYGNTFGIGIWTEGTTNNYIYNNTLTGNRVGIFSDTGTGVNYIKNNIVSNNNLEGTSTLAETELIGNSSFEINTTGWYKYDGTPTSSVFSRTTVIGEFDSGSAGAKIVVNTGGGTLSFWYANITVEDGKWYKITFRAKATTDFAMGSIFRIHENSSPWESRTDVEPPASAYIVTTSWQTFTGYFKANADSSTCRIMWRFDNLGSGEIVYIDTISLKESNYDVNGGMVIKSGDLISDYNVVYNNENEFYDIGTLYITLSAYQSATSQDLHSISADPLLNTDYTLKSNSPCIGAGVDVGIRDDYAGNPRPDLGEGNCDIGAFEMREREIAMNYIKGDTGRIIHGDKIIRHSSLYRTKYT